MICSSKTFHRLFHVHYVQKLEILSFYTKKNGWPCPLTNKSLPFHFEQLACVYSTLVKISIFCSNNLAKWFSRNWLLARCVFELASLSSRVALGWLREELVLAVPALSECRCLFTTPHGRICFTSIPTPSNCKMQQACMIEPMRWVQ